MLRTIARNIASNWAGYAVNAVVIFFLTPFVLHSLGDTRYGIWILVNGLTGYFGLLNLGLSGGTTQYLTRYLAQKDYAAVNRAASASVMGLSACGLLVVVVSALLSWLAPFIFTVPENDITEIRLCITVLGVTTAAQFGFFPFHAVFTALQRFDLSNAIAIPLRLLSAVGTYIALQMGYGLVGLCVVNATTELVGCVTRLLVAYWLLPQLRVSPRMAAWIDFRPILSYGMVNTLIQGAIILKNYSSSLVIALFMPLAALAPFNLAAGLVLQIERLFGPVSTVFFPVATQLDAQGDRAGMRRIYFTMSRALLCAGVAVALIGGIWAADFYRLWVGARFVEGKDHVSVVFLFWILMAATVISVSQSIGGQILLGCRAMKVVSLLMGTEALATVVLMLSLTPLLGLKGVVLAIFLPTAVVRGILSPLAVCRLIEVRPREYFRAAYLRPCLFGCLLTGPLVLLHSAVPVHHSWAMLAMCGVLAGLTAVPFLLFVGLDRYERYRMFFTPLFSLRAQWLGTRIADVPKSEIHV